MMSKNIFVAKSYQKLPQIGEAYVTENNKLYINIQMPSGKVKTVRAYTETEYAKMYGEKIEKPVSEFIHQKQALGFEKGYITIFRGDTYANLEWFQDSIARYCKWWGWYIVSTDEIPQDIPEGIVPVQLAWELVGTEQGCLKPDEKVKMGVESVLYESSNSEFIGNVGERLTLTLKVIAAHQKDGVYGLSTVHYLEDDDGNRYLWNTSAKSWNPGEQYSLKGTVKDHKIIKNVKTTILTRCSLLK